MKKTLSIILSLVLVIAALPLAAVESDAATILTSQDGLWKYYVNADNTTITINSGGSSKAYLGTDTDVTVPSAIDGYPVMIVGNYAFYNYTDLESVTIPNTVTSIGNNAFQNCSSLADVDMGSGVLTIGSSAFANCTSFEEIEIGSSVQTINGGAFQACSNLKKVVIPPSVTTINGRYTFYQCNTDLKTYITDLAAWCKINFNGGSGDYGSNPLEFGHNLYIYDSIADDYILAENIVIPSGITSISAGAFNCCTSIKSVVIPEGVTTINQYSFRGCSNLESITIPSSLTTVSGANVFSGCSSLNAVYITDVAAWCNISFTSNSCESNPLYYAHNIYVNGVLSAVTIPGTVSEIKPYTFYGLANDVAFSEGLQKIGNFAFYNATGINNLVLPNSLTTVNDSAFYGNTALESVTFGSGLATIGNSMFCKCTALESVTIPNTVTAIGTSAFQNCSALTDVDMGSGVLTIGSSAFANCTSFEEIEIGSSVQTINGGAFQACSNLKKVVIPPSVTTINGRYTFYNCHADLKTYITDLEAWCKINFNGGSGDYASNPTEYGRKLYINNELVTELVIPEDVTIISAGAFHGCTGITKVTVPASVTSINQFAFRRCSDMKHLIVAGQSVSLGSRALEGCDSLEHIYCYIGSNAASFNSSKTAYLGDMDSDGTIDINDIGAVISASAGNLNMTEVQEIVADYNLDGAVDGFDAAELDRYVY